MKKYFDIKGKVIVITGAAGRLGSFFSAVMAERGATVVAADVDIERLRRKKEAQKRAGLSVRTVYMDVTDAACVRESFAKIGRRYKKIDVLVNNAALQVFSRFEKRTEDEYRQVIDSNLKGAIFCSQQVVKFMKGRAGSIINIGSIYGVVSPDPRVYGRSGRNNSEVYGAGKAAMIQLTKYLAVHLARHGIRVNCVSPGGIFAGQDSAFVKNYCRRVPLGRMAKESDLAGALIYLASDSSSYITGHNLVVDGGLTIW